MNEKFASPLLSVFSLNFLAIISAAATLRCVPATEHVCNTTSSSLLHHLTMMSFTASHLCTN